MKRWWNTPWAALAAANVLCFCMLSFYETSHAEPRETNQPFANAVEQRLEIINQLKELNALVKEQNALMRSGELVVVVAEPKKP